MFIKTYSKIPKLYGMKNTITEEVIDKLDMFQEIFGKVYDLGWWDMEIIQTDAVTQFTPREFQKGISVCWVQIALAEPDHQDTKVQVEVTWQTLRTIADQIKVHTRVSDEYIHFELIYTTNNIFNVSPIKPLVNQDG